MDHSSYGDTVKFYERMSQLHVELKNYENEQHRLEDEFGRMRNEHGAITHPSTFSSSGLLMPSTSVDNPNPNYSNSKEAEDRRRQRNQAILGKIQELETNASVYAARSERLRMMRSEYESLVRKWALQRKWSSSTSQWQGNKISATPGAGDFISFNSDMNSNKGCGLVTIGVNTDITGPVKAIPPYDNDREEVVEKVIEKTDSYLLGVGQSQENYQYQQQQQMEDVKNPAGTRKILFSTPEKLKDANEEEEKEKNGKFYANRIHPLFDISSTSESQSDFPVRNVNPFDITLPDDTSETTSISITPAQQKNRRDLLFSLTDNSQSESTAENFHAKTNKDANKRAGAASARIPAGPISSDDVLANNKTDLMSSSALAASSMENVRKDSSAAGGNGYSPVDIVNAKRKSSLEGRTLTESESPTTSIGDSMMDSVQNKLTQKLGKEEMNNIAREQDDEENENSHSNNTSRLINENDNEEQETLDDLSSPKMTPEEIALGTQTKYQTSSSTAVPIPTSNKVASSAPPQNSNAHVDQMENDIISFKPSGTGVSLQSILIEKKPEMEKVEERNEAKHELKENEPIDDSASASNKKEMAMFKAPLTNIETVTGSSRPKTTAKPIRLKLDYNEDSESDVSDVAPVKPRSSLLGESAKHKEIDNTKSKQTSQQKYDEEFDDFFDI